MFLQDFNELPVAYVTASRWMLPVADVTAQQVYLQLLLINFD